ncbi:hypothetical protein EUGRSUZ_K01883 [Eucalyptus grandis]|uniref:Uncharacterized protein n=2 Tax=Eucalyptus grandis TaxID=71139 RepID=A0ACC3IVQ5_EUCGR|nr:hypothetical protein EUGRSUZ_K01883 [Eucalyptus grandis]
MSQYKHLRITISQALASTFDQQLRHQVHNSSSHTYFHLTSVLGQLNFPESILILAHPFSNQWQSPQSTLVSQLSLPSMLKTPDYVRKICIAFIVRNSRSPVSECMYSHFQLF